MYHCRMSLSRVGPDIGRILVLCAVAASLVVSCSKRREGADSSVAPRTDATTQGRSASRTILPPDLSRCVRLEVRYLRSVTECLFSVDRNLDLLNGEEKEYLQSLSVITVRDPERIATFARDISSGSFERIGEASHSLILAQVRCYIEGRPPSVLVLFDSHVVTEDECWFAYSGDSYPHRRGPMLGILVALTPEVRGFSVRRMCAHRLGALYVCVNINRKSRAREERMYPAASYWCDDVVLFCRAQYGSTSIQEAAFKCPGAHDGPCNYALNPNCRPDSAPDTVLLFETAGGWNQYGGPELFTFDNHDPKGGLVLLNDGTEEFIHTEEQLKQLRWK
jgi:hypothetical protein